MATTTTDSKGLKTLLGAAALSVLSMILLTSLPGCNTTEGIGKDIKSAGAGIEETARDAKN